MNWIQKNNIWVSEQPLLPGVWQRRDGGFFVRGSFVDAKTGKEKEIKKSLLDAKTAQEAKTRLVQLLDEAREGKAIPEKRKPRFSEFVAQFVERKVSVFTKKSGWKSEATRKNRTNVIVKHLIPRFGEYFIDKITRKDVEDWQRELARQVNAGKIVPRTANDRLRELQMIMSAACKEYRLPDNPAAEVEPLDDSEHPVYTKEQPNSLTPAELQVFTDKVRELYPQYYALVVLGFATGLRPSSLRPLRWKGEESDLNLDECTLQIRRSHSRAQRVMACTKTGTHFEIALPKAIVDVLREHIELLPEYVKQRSDLLFPGKVGFLAQPLLDSVFRRVRVKLGWKKRITPRGMRRTFQDLARGTHMHDFVTRSISGHATIQMQQHYSTIYESEQREGIAKIIELAKFKPIVKPAAYPAALAVSQE